MKRISILRLVSLLVLVALFGGVGQPLVGAQSEPLVLARVQVPGMVNELGLPVYAHLQDAAGNDYALVIASVSQLDKVGVSYTILDTNVAGVMYLVAEEYQPGARQQVARSFDVLLDDGRHVVVRATPERAEALAALGFEIAWFDQTPMVLAIPAAVVESAVDFDPLVDEMINAVAQSTVYDYDGDLSGEWSVPIGGSNYTILTRYTNSGTPIQKATQYVYEFMQDLGLGVSYHNWTSGSYSNRNVVGVQTGTTNPDEIILVMAHLDDVPSSGRAPGADDNASGSVGVMLAAEIMSQYQLERTVRYVFFTGEEQGLLGSKRYADKVYNDGDNIVAVFNMDMIAWDDIGGPVVRVVTRTTSNPGYPGDRAIADVFIDVVSTYGLSGDLDPYISTSGTSASDHSSFWNKGYSAVLLIEDGNDFNDYYHTSNDKLQYLNMPYFTANVKASVGTAAHLARPVGSGPTPTPTATDTPTRTPTGVPPTATPTPTSPPGNVVFFDDFETSQGWTTNPFGDDTATTGLWERANPETTEYSGVTYQLGTTVSGSYDLVTEGSAGSSVGSYDIDGGDTTVRSPSFTLPSSGDVTLSFSYYLAHYSNATSDDYLRVKVVGSTTQTVFEELGAGNTDGAAWDTFSTSLNDFRGQTVYLLIEAADGGGGSLVEAAVDDVLVESSEVPPPTPTTEPPTPTPTGVPPTPTPTGVPPTPTPTSGPGVVFFDDFESSQGWTTNPFGDDAATTGMWERANPESTSYSGVTYQLGATVSGSYDLVTEGSAGSSVGSYDIDNGDTTIRSPNITLPGSGDVTLSFSYYLAHYSNATSDDYLRVKVVGSTTQTVFEELGAGNTDAAAWDTFSTSLNDFRGQTVYLLIEAADGGGGSLVEAAIDDVLIESN